MSAHLYGLRHSSRSTADMWGKNQFNSCFPVSLLIWMADHGVKPVVAHSAISPSGVYFDIHNEEREVAQVLGTDAPPSELYYAFEHGYDDFDRLMIDGDQSNRADVVVFEAAPPGSKLQHGRPVRPFEIKLTVVPDVNTARKDPSKWSAELVLRPATTSFCAMSIYSNMRQELRSEVDEKMRELKLHDIESWSNQAEINSKFDAISSAVRYVLKESADTQVPLVLHPIWVTQGLSPFLADDAFDMFVWTDSAIMSVLFNEALRDSHKVEGNGILRYRRSVVRFCNAIRDLCSKKTFNYAHIYSGIGFRKQTDKEVTIPAITVRKYLTSDRMAKRKVRADVVNEIVLGGGMDLLSPERRFDQTLYFTVRKRD